MSEFIGSRISLISKSDIRYVGTLHEINSENATVALENVTSFGTEGRKNDHDDEIPGSDSIYEYIVFRGSDVKDLRIEEPPKENKPPPPQVPNDPAILGSGSRPQGQNGQRSQPPPGEARQNNYPQGPQFPNQGFPNQPYGGPGGPGVSGYGPPGPGYPPYGPPPPHYGGPPGWQGPPSHMGGPGYPGSFNGPFSPQQHQQLAFGGPGPQQLTHQRQQPSQGPLPPSAPGAGNAQPNPTREAANKAGAVAAPSKLDKAPGTSSTENQAAPPPPVDSKPDPASAMAPPPSQPSNRGPGPRTNRIVPAVPLANPAAKKFSAVAAAPANNAYAKPPQAAADVAIQHQNATTQAATAAVAAAMAKLANPAAGGVDNLTQKVNEMRVDERNRSSERGRGRGPRRGGAGRGGPRGIEVPNSDFDFESANAKFDKQTVAQKAGSGRPALSPGADGTEDVTGNEEVVIPPAELAYTKDSFFDNLSREDAADGRQRRQNGQEFRREDRKLNVETFGLSSVDYGRGGYRGRGRGRGGFNRGLGRGRGGARGRDGIPANSTPAAI